MQPEDLLSHLARRAHVLEMTGSGPSGCSWSPVSTLPSLLQAAWSQEIREELPLPGVSLPSVPWLVACPSDKSPLASAGSGASRDFLTSFSPREEP